MTSRALFLLLFLFCGQVQAQNYDEAKIPAYILPSPLVALDKTPVKTKKQWETKRRPEILQLFEDQVYGKTPRGYDNLQATVTNENKLAMGGKAHLREVQIAVFEKGKSVTINLILFTPNEVKGPAPAFLLINHRNKENTDPTREKKSDFWPAEMVIDAGYAMAAFHVSDVAPDNKTTFQEGVLQLYPGQLTADNGMRTLGAWAWGASRVLDFLQKDAKIAKDKVAVIGHSRGGKAALWAAAQDQRFAFAGSNESGTGGASLARREFGETVARINTQFPHWFTTNYKKYNDKVGTLPVDQHLLIALMAPRPVYVATAEKDLWGDPKGSFLALKHAELVYALYGIKPLPATEQPPVNTPIIQSHLGYHMREGIHNMTRYDWSQYVAFANYHFSQKQTPIKEKK